MIDMMNGKQNRRTKSQKERKKENAEKKAKQIKHQFKTQIASTQSTEAIVKTSLCACISYRRIRKLTDHKGEKKTKNGSLLACVQARR